MFFLHTVQGLKVFLFNITNCIEHHSFVHTVKQLHVLQDITNNSINISHLFTRLNNQTVLFLTIQLNISHLFGQFESSKNPTTESNWTWEQRQ